MQAHTQQTQDAQNATMYTQWQKIRKSLFGLKSSLLTAGLFASVAFAAPTYAVTCGDVIGDEPGERKVVLTADVGGCDDDDGTSGRFAGITVVGPATLDLNGFNVGCQDRNLNGREPTAAIRLTGERAKLIGRGGMVLSCPTGVLVEGGGKHRVEGVVSFGNEMGFSVTSSRNTLKKNMAQHTEDGPGYRISGTRNALIDNTAQDTYRGAGIILVGERHRMMKNLVQRNGNYIVAPGISVLGERHTLMRNESRQNSGDGISLAFSADRVKVMRNETRLNGLRGIVAQSGSQRNTIMRNVARNNGTTNGSEDMFDLNVTPGSGFNCGTNRWRNNDFGSALQCID